MNSDLGTSSGVFSMPKMKVGMTAGRSLLGTANETVPVRWRYVLPGFL
jgi:hypothetical protein